MVSLVLVQPQELLVLEELGELEDERSVEVVQQFLGPRQHTAVLGVLLASRVDHLYLQDLVPLGAVQFSCRRKVWGAGLVCYSYNNDNNLYCVGG